MPRRPIAIMLVGSASVTLIAIVGYTLTDDDTIIILWFVGLLFTEFDFTLPAI